MSNESTTAIFDRQAATYDQQWHRLAALNAALHLLINAVFEKLPPTAHVLCVGAGTGAEILHLAQRFPGWRFTAVEPSASMLEVLRAKATEQGVAARCVLHAGFLDTLPHGVAFDAATALLVSQFHLDRSQRTRFFREIASRLRPDGLLVSSDLAGDPEAPENRHLLSMWFTLMSNGGVSDEDASRMRAAYNRDVAVVPAAEIERMIEAGGFAAPTQFFQAGMIRGWFAQRGGQANPSR